MNYQVTDRIFWDEEKCEEINFNGLKVLNRSSIIYLNGEKTSFVVKDITTKSDGYYSGEVFCKDDLIFRSDKRADVYSFLFGVLCYNRPFTTVKS